LWALIAKEINPPPGVEPIEWKLLSDWKIDSLKTARRMVRWYGLRWGIECWHQVLKDVCKVEKRQMKSAKALGRALAVDMIVAWRVLLLCRMGKTHPNLPASLLYSPEELAVLEVLKKKTPSFERALIAAANNSEAKPLPIADALEASAAAHDQPSTSTLTVLQANLLVAMLAGFWARKSDGHPGPKLVERGLVILKQLVQWERIKKQSAQKNLPAKQPRGKPG